jgi:hypothetical protein
MTRARKAKAPAPAIVIDAHPWPEPQDATGWGLHIHRRYDMSKWREQLEKVPEEHRAGAEEYLRGIAARMRVVRRLKGSPDGPPSTS